MTSQEKLSSRIDLNYHICVGLDSDLNKIPEHLKQGDNPILDFNKRIIDGTCDGAAAYKINFAFYEQSGIKGIDTLQKTIEYIPKDILIIADAKRGDIGNTSLKYAESVFDHFNCDSITLHPYMGRDSVDPFLEYKNKICFILALTSNPGSFDFEKQKLASGKFLFQEVISQVNNWNTDNNCGLVFGATNIEELKDNISSFDDMPVLLPGVGAQGGSLEDVVQVFKSQNKRNFLINISRGLIYCDTGKSFQDEVRSKIFNYNQIVKQILN
jgi:orotidine-5'-phosphate decarboxylase